MVEKYEDLDSELKSIIDGYLSVNLDEKLFEELVLIIYNNACRITDEKYLNFKEIITQLFDRDDKMLNIINERIESHNNLVECLIEINSEVEELKRQVKEMKNV